MQKKPEERWFELKGLPTCSCGRSLCKKGMVRELQSPRNHRPGPSAGMIRSGVATIRLDCFGCHRSWDARFLCVDRFERGTARSVPTDCWPVRWNERPEETLARVLEDRQRAENGEGPNIPRAAEYIPPMTPEQAQKARENIAKIRARMGWT